MTSFGWDFKMKYFLIDKIFDPLERGFVKWYYADAKWYEFWMPGSGYSGGLISMLLTFAVLMLILRF